jgi:hypothetical protein
MLPTDEEFLRMALFKTEDKDFEAIKGHLDYDSKFL